ncbi:hypothetical protein V6N12_036754 [Hibiscus sabdariffa]|uniref:Uncharacterized protein n=1 Tax=Hibiscus sabdariffa TaxID=183260 RepID=A0ABR2BA08_9ROSI
MRSHGIREPGEDALKGQKEKSCGARQRPKESTQHRLARQTNRGRTGPRKDSNGIQSTRPASCSWHKGTMGAVKARS